VIRGQHWSSLIIPVEEFSVCDLGKTVFLPPSWVLEIFKMPYEKFNCKFLSIYEGKSRPMC
jgi:hypothetical protein